MSSSHHSQKPCQREGDIIGHAQQVVQNLQTLPAGAQEQGQGADLNHGCLQDKGD